MKDCRHSQLKEQEGASYKEGARGYQEYTTHVAGLLSIFTKFDFHFRLAYLLATVVDQRLGLDIRLSTSSCTDWFVLCPPSAKISRWRPPSRRLTGRPLVMIVHAGAYWRPTTGLDGP